MARDSDFETYRAEMDPPLGITPCHCGMCEWRGVFADLDDIGDCCLTPGDASPAGRCPMCDSLAYPDAKETAASEPAEDAAQNVRMAVAHLRAARDLLKEAGAVRTLRRVRFALTSAAGAVRHAENAAGRAHLAEG